MMDLTVNSATLSVAEIYGLKPDELLVFSIHEVEGSNVSEGIMKKSKHLKPPIRLDML